MSASPAGDESGLVLLGAQRPAVEFRVADTGIGIPESERERVFDAFYQVDSSSTREQGGTGLGLSIVKRLVEGHDGEVRVEGNSTEGHGVRRAHPHQARDDAMKRRSARGIREGEAIRLLADAFGQAARGRRSVSESVMTPPCSRRHAAFSSGRWIAASRARTSSGGLLELGDVGVEGASCGCE